MSNFDIDAFMSSLGTPDVGATTDYDYSFDPSDYRSPSMPTYDLNSKDFDAGDFMRQFDLTSSPAFDDRGFNLDFLSDLESGDLSDYSNDYEDIFGSLPGLIGAAGKDEKGFLESAIGKALSDKVFGGVLPSGGRGKPGLLEMLGLLGATSFAKDRGMLDPDRNPVGYQGSIPEYTAIREQVTGRDDTDRRPGSGGRRYFSDTMYAKKPEGQQPMSVEEARAKAKAQAGGFMEGGQVLEDGGYLQGASDGQADLVPGDIDGVQEARLSHGEYVLPADLVAILGNGNSDAGAAALDDFMSTVRKKATGTPKQQKNIDADQVLAMLSKRMS